MRRASTSGCSTYTAATSRYAVSVSSNEHCGERTRTGLKRRSLGRGGFFGQHGSRYGVTRGETRQSRPGLGWAFGAVSEDLHAALTSQRERGWVITEVVSWAEVTNPRT
jgi:hypothetical protein